MHRLLVLTLLTVLFAGCASESNDAPDNNPILASKPGDPVSSSNLREGPGGLSFSDGGFGGSPLGNEAIVLTPLEPVFTRTFTYNGPASDFDGPAPVAVYIPTTELVEMNLNTVDVEAELFVDGVSLHRFVGVDDLDAAAVLDAPDNGTVTLEVRVFTTLAWTGNVNWGSAVLALPRIANYAFEYDHSSFCNTFFIFFCDVQQSYTVALPDAPIQVERQASIQGVELIGGPASVSVLQECISGASMADGYGACYHDALRWTNGSDLKAPSTASTTIFGENFPSSYHWLILQTGTKAVTVSADNIQANQPTSQAMTLTARHLFCDCQPPARAEWDFTAQTGQLNLTTMDGITLRVTGASVTGAGEPREEDGEKVYGTGNAVVRIDSGSTFAVKVGAASTPTPPSGNQTIAHRLLQ
ncbi:MAG: hypothetical protein ACPHK8_04015 [Thermoplasmatota archaeon]